ncbi:hypothetical protein DERF_012102 [Dermatophagoides farinae]|uniref:Uncharacterized protein n=1 Tax=Dermatophagoides farinae TaxID=6954 RepID=A0A922KXU6_DERFA|nr:hypothetical protein DERF_012102 [Dermatophagoides farinae]
MLYLDNPTAQILDRILILRKNRSFYRPYRYNRYFAVNFIVSIIKIWLWFVYYFKINLDFGFISLSITAIEFIWNNFNEFSGLFGYFRLIQCIINRLILFIVIIEEFAGIFGIHLLFALANRQFQKSSITFMHILAKKHQHINRHIYIANRLKIINYGQNFHAKNKYGFTYGKLELITMNECVKYLLLYSQLLINHFNVNMKGIILLLSPLLLYRPSFYLQHYFDCHRLARENPNEFQRKIHDPISC